MTNSIPIQSDDDYKTFMSKVVCSIDSRACMLKQCDSCPGKEKLVRYLNNLFDDEKYHFDEAAIKFKVWSENSKKYMNGIMVQILSTAS